MERTVPRTDSDAIELYIRTYYSLLRSSGDIAIQTLAESHIGMESLLHVAAGERQPDCAALAYASLRLPACAAMTNLVILGQRSAVFEREGFEVETWQQVSAPARRRRAYYDGAGTLALYIASRSDIDDIIPILTAYQIEWNKIHRLLAGEQGQQFLDRLAGQHPLADDQLTQLAERLTVSRNDLAGLAGAWQDDLIPILQMIAARPKHFYLRLLAGSLADYRKATRYWWINLRSEAAEIDFENRRVYFVSSNTHSLVNMWSGYALRHRDKLKAYLEEAGHADLLTEYQHIEANSVPSSRENFLYYTMKKYLQDSPPEINAGRMEEEKQIGVHRIASKHGFDLDAQVFEIGKLDVDRCDPRLRIDGMETLSHSDALIVNIDYPLGMAAYEILTRIVENVGQLNGIYIMGKAATLNGRIGDVMIPIVIHDEHSDNTYLFENCFSASEVAPYLAYGSVLDNQKAVTVRGTFLQNQRYMSVFYREGYTDIEMEAGPYLSAIYELFRPRRHPQDEIVSLHPVQFLDIGILHYASDKPLSKGQGLGAGSLSYRGMDPTYAAAVAILREIMGKEIKWLMANGGSG